MKQIAKTWAGCDANHVNYDRDETHPRATVRTLFGKIPDQHSAHLLTLAARGKPHALSVR
jgi:hypothetical protein